MTSSPHSKSYSTE